ncbi:ribonuclease Z, partial [Priestia flexa]|nr:ribonuclease Z [Priestia flexa]
LEDGREINGAEFIGESKPGKIVTILGDTRMCENSTMLAENANVLVHEATFAEGDEKLAYDYYHSTAKQAAQVARQANVQQL